MTATAEFTEYVLELLGSIHDVSTKRFFGGVGISHDTVQFAMIMGNSLYFVVDDITREKYTKVQKEPFSYLTKKGRVLVKKYYEVPEHLFDDQDELTKWANESIVVAKKTKKSRKRNNP